MPEDIRLRPLHQFHVICGQFERRTLEVHVSGRGREHEAEVYVYDVPVDIDKDVGIVSILDVEVILDQGVSSKTLDEIGEAGLPIKSEDLPIDVLQTALMRHLFEKTDGASIVDELNEP